MGRGHSVRGVPCQPWAALLDSQTVGSSPGAHSHTPGLSLPCSHQSPRTPSCRFCQQILVASLVPERWHHQGSGRSQGPHAHLHGNTGVCQRDRLLQGVSTVAGVTPLEGRHPPGQQRPHCRGQDKVPITPPGLTSSHGQPQLQRTLRFCSEGHAADSRLRSQHV